LPTIIGTDIGKTTIIVGELRKKEPVKPTALQLAIQEYRERTGRVQDPNSARRIEESERQYAESCSERPEEL
jgi:hypothetical protein